MAILRSADRFEKSPNFRRKRRANIDGIIIHYTASPSLERTVALFKRKESKVSAHFVIGRDGEIVQMVDTDHVAWHAGSCTHYNGEPLKKGSSVNRRTVGIELANWGLLKKRGPRYYSWPKNYRTRFEGKTEAADGKLWEKYSGDTMHSCARVCEELVNMYPLISEQSIQGHQDVAPDRKTDPGAAFDWGFIKTEVFSQDRLSTEEEYDQEMINRAESRRDPGWFGRIRTGR